MELHHDDGDVPGPSRPDFKDCPAVGFVVALFILIVSDCHDDIGPFDLSHVGIKHGILPVARTKFQTFFLVFLWIINSV